MLFFTLLTSGVMVQTVILIGLIFPVERALKRRFDSEGNVR